MHNHVLKTVYIFRIVLAVVSGVTHYEFLHRLLAMPRAPRDAVTPLQLSMQSRHSAQCCIFAANSTLCTCRGCRPHPSCLGTSDTCCGGHAETGNIICVIAFELRELRNRAGHCTPCRQVRVLVASHKRVSSPFLG